MDLVEPVTWGPARFWPQDGRVHFEVVLDVADRPAEEMDALVERVGPWVKGQLGSCPSHGSGTGS